MSLHRTFISITPQQIAWLREAKRRTGRSYSEIVRQALDDFIRRQPDAGLVTDDDVTRRRAD